MASAYDPHNEKKDVIESVRPVTAAESDEESSLDQPEWQPGWKARFPILGFGALVIVVLCAVADILVLHFSDQKSQTDWPKKIAPNVILSGLNSLSSICFSIAIGNGIAIAWWRRALKGSTIQDLHRSWSFSTSLKEVAVAGKYFNVIALAALTTKLTIIDNVLMQRATTTYVGTDKPVNMTIQGSANSSIPTTGQTSGRSADPGLMTKAFSDDIKAWAQSPLSMPGWGFPGCEGFCFLEIDAAGFEFDCTEPTSTAVDYGVQVKAALAAQSSSISGSSSSDSSSNSTDSSSNGTSTVRRRQDITSSTSVSNTSATVFSISFDKQYSPYDESIGANLTMDISYTQANDDLNDNSICPGSLYQQSCVLRPALISYPAFITYDPQSTTDAALSLGTTYEMWSNPTLSGIPVPKFSRAQKQQEGFKVLKYIPTVETHNTGLPTESYLAGIQQGLRMYLGASSSFSFGGATGEFQIDQGGASPQYLMNSPIPSQCGYKYADPMSPDEGANVQSVVAAINQIMFSLATGMGVYAQQPASLSFVNDGVRDFKALGVKLEVHYETNTAYMIGAVVSIFVCVALVLPVYWGYWQLGRKVSLGPFEVAHAFRSPMMSAPAVNGTIDELMREVGPRKVQFGQIVAGDAKGVLGVAEPEYVAKVEPTAGSVGGPSRTA
ncbi:hypothetical protein LTR86_000192 [Recurvomyces mirabilis]|nr:hypothetical protein LTR86_000192 [Recurvomyces mirabilis]